MQSAIRRRCHEVRVEVGADAAVSEVHCSMLLAEPYPLDAKGPTVQAILASFLYGARATGDSVSKSVYSRQRSSWVY